ncbi:dehydrogenase, partial [Campylobacter coli]|nr:dehydrogenase [Campylobacter coli]
MIKILLIGCGQLGIRYLQGFFSSYHELIVQIIEPSNHSRANVDNM